MITEVKMKRELFGMEISQRSKSEMFSGSALALAGNKWRAINGLPRFDLNAFLKTKSTQEFIDELKNKTEGDVIIKGRGRNAQTWVHPLLFIDIALAISPKLKIEVYDWLFDNLIKYRNESGDSYKEAIAALFTRCTNQREFPELVKRTANYIKAKMKVDDWNEATEEQLKQRDKIHVAIKLYSKVLTDIEQIVRLSVKEVLEPNQLQPIKNK